MQLHDKFTIVIPPQDIHACPGCLERFAEGDRDAFEWLYSNYSKKVFDYVMLMTADTQQSEDIVQEVFLRLWVKREKLKQVEHFNNYLFIITRNITISIFKKNNNERFHLFELLRQLPRITSSLQEDIEIIESRQIILKAVQVLPKQQKLAFQLQREWGWTCMTIAKALGLAPSTIKSHLKIGMKTVKGIVKNQLN